MSISDKVFSQNFDAGYAAAFRGDAVPYFQNEECRNAFLMGCAAYNARHRKVPEQEQIAETLGICSEKLPSGNTGIDATLAERGSRYGQFKDQAVYADKINDVLVSSPNWAKMAPDQREALRIIANKIGRILNGDPNYSDSWHDIAGYAKLVDDRLNGVSK